jgi:cytochrome c oxidase subunit 2
MAARVMFDAGASIGDESTTNTHMNRTYLRHAALACAAFAASLLSFTYGALAEGRPHEWQIGLQDAATPTMERVNSFHNMLLVIIIAIAAFVLVLLLYVMARFRESVHPTPSKTTHNTAIEVAWTIVPIMILVLIAVFSFPLLYFVNKVPEAEAREKGAPVMTIKATASQFQWNYTYYKVDAAGTSINFDSLLLCRTAEECKDPELKEATGGKQPLRLLDVDKRMVVPVGAYVRMQTTARDVIHSFAVPSFGIKLDAVPGRLNETWFRPLREGVYYGQCSELCGAGHGYMPISIQVVSKEKYEAWLAAAMKNDDYNKTKPSAELPAAQPKRQQAQATAGQ